jgi:hypothetical protein
MDNPNSSLQERCLVLLMARRRVLLCGALFALFCFALELEHLGQAFGGGQPN